MYVLMYAMVNTLGDVYNSWNQASSEILKLLYDFRQDPKKFLTVNFKLF